MELKEPLNFRELLQKPMTFSLEMNRSMDDFLDDDIDDEEKPETKTTPWKDGFDELKLLMVKIPKYEIYKRILKEGNGDVIVSKNCRIKWTYSIFLEKEEYSYDSSYLAGSQVRVSLGEEIMPGIWFAINTMRIGEESHFIIDSKLMYGKLGVSTGTVQIKPNADILLVAKLINFQEIGSETACNSLNDDELRQFHLVKEKAVEMQKKVRDLYRKQHYNNAIYVGLNMIERVTFSEVQIDNEMTEKNEILAKVSEVLIECYIKIEDYKKAKKFIKNLREISDVDKNVDVLVNEAIVLSKTDDDYNCAIGLLRKAQLLEPTNERINKELSGIQKAKDDYNAQRKQFMQRAFQTRSQPNTLPSKKTP